MYALNNVFILMRAPIRQAIPDLNFCFRYFIKYSQYIATIPSLGYKRNLYGRNGMQKKLQHSVIELTVVELTGSSNGQKKENKNLCF